MAFHKKAEFETNAQLLAGFHKALSHPARIAILETLAERRSCVCGELVDVLPLAQATVSQHLRELKDAGFIRGEIEGKFSCYCLDWDKLDEVESSFLKFFQGLREYKLEQDRSCC
jgi:ArsR family transcriptional regulator